MFLFQLRVSRERTVSTVLVAMVTSSYTFRHADGGIAATCRYDAVRFVESHSGFNPYRTNVENRVSS